MQNIWNWSTGPLSAVIAITFSFGGTFVINVWKNMAVSPIYVKRTEFGIIAHASGVDRKTTIKNAVPGEATRDGHMTTVPDCSKLKKVYITKNEK